MSQIKQPMCPNIENHTFAPDGYLSWHAWANEMSKTHVQRKCAGCGRYEIWEPFEQPIRRVTAETCPDCKGAGYIGGQDTPSSCGNEWHKHWLINAARAALDEHMALPDDDRNTGRSMMIKLHTLLDAQQLASVYKCISCGSPANVEGDTGCECVSGLLFRSDIKQRGANGILRGPKLIDSMIGDLEAQIADLRDLRASNLSAICAAIEVAHDPMTETQGKLT